MPHQVVTVEAVEAGFHRLLPGDEEGFAAMRRTVVAHQQANNPVYGRYCKTFPDWETPLLPVEAFKHAMLASCVSYEAVFESSGTGQGLPGRHPVCKTAVYQRSFETHFQAVFGDGPFTIVAHLPHYASRGGASSLLYMVSGLIQRFGDPASGFFLEDVAVLHQAIAQRRSTGTSLILFGAAFGLLDLVECGAPRLPANARVIETGGMKTYRRAIGRAQLHEQLAAGFGVERRQVISEYGMCELLSQCYTRGGEVFFPPPWMRMAVVDPEDPRTERPEGVEGALAVVDLANVYSVSALLTQDRAVQVGGGFQVLGRLSGAELRGCNFLLEQLR